MITLWRLKRELTWIQESGEINLDRENVCLYGLEKKEEVVRINIHLYSIGWKTKQKT